MLNSPLTLSSICAAGRSTVTAQGHYMKQRVMGSGSRPLERFSRTICAALLTCISVFALIYGCRNRAPTRLHLCPVLSGYAECCPEPGVSENG